MWEEDHWPFSYFLDGGTGEKNEVWATSRMFPLEVNRTLNAKTEFLSIMHMCKQWCSL